MVEHGGAPVRVLLLARAGEARQRLQTALGEAGAELVRSVDPLEADPGEILALRLGAVLVALEPAIEDALEAFDALLSDPDVLVMFDEADLAARRDGWDAARWVRHLAAKLHGHRNVLPEGTEAEDVGLPVTDQTAHERVADVPGTDSAGSDAPMGLVAAEDMDWSSSASADDDLLGDDPALAELLATASAAQSREVAHEPPARGLDDTFFLEPLEEDGSEAMPSDADADAASGTQSAEDPAEAPGIDPLSLGSTLSLVDDDALLATQRDEPAIDLDALEARMGGLSLADDDGPIVVKPRSEELDLGALEGRLSGLSLADPDSYGHGVLRGAVMVEAGLGGPDAVRQLLGGLGEAFVRPVLVRLQLDGGRYERLVQQMQRASVLPVALAEAGGDAEGGVVYFLPPDVALVDDRSRLRFAATEPGAAVDYAALPATDSALIFLSGANADRIDRAMALADAGALVLAQSPDSCYDAAAVNALVGRGAVTAEPGDLAQALIDRWP